MKACNPCTSKGRHLGLQGEGEGQVKDVIIWKGLAWKRHIVDMKAVSGLDHQLFIYII